MSPIAEENTAWERILMITIFTVTICKGTDLLAILVKVDIVNNTTVIIDISLVIWHDIEMRSYYL